MATMSIEILCVGAVALPLPELETVGVDVSYPPKSDRRPSLWQNRIDGLGGTLVHLFDLERRGHNRRWAYEIVSESDWETFRFKPPVWHEVRVLMEQLLEISPQKKIEFYSDAQWSNPATINEELNMKLFSQIHDQSVIRMNTAFPILR